MFSQGQKSPEQFDFLLTHAALSPGTMSSCGPLWGPLWHPFGPTSVYLNSDDYGSLLLDLVLFVLVNPANN